MKAWTKGFIWSLIIIIFGLGIILNRGCIMAHLTSEFRFEKYKTAEEAKAALLKLHPVGSSVDELALTLQKAGMTVMKNYQFKSVNPQRDMLDQKYNYKNLYARYEWKTSFLPWSISVVQIIIKYNKNNTIKEFNLTSHHD